MLRLVIVVLALLAAAPTSAYAQQCTSAKRAVDPHFVGCQPPTATVARTNILPLAVGDTAAGATVGQVLQQMIAADVSAALGYAPLSPSTLGQPGGPAQLDGTGRASALSVLPTGAYTPRTLANRAADSLNIKDFGADPTGATDSTAAWNRACAAAPAAGGVIYFPVGRYLGSSPWVCAGKALKVHGDNDRSSVVLVDHTGIGMSIAPSAASQTVTVADIGFIAQGSCASTSALSVVFPLVGSYPLNNLTIHNVSAVPGPLNSSNGLQSCDPSSFATGINFNGAWLARIGGLNLVGPLTTGAPLITSHGVNFGNSYGTIFEKINAATFGYALFQTDYSEGTVIGHSQLVNVMVGVGNSITGGRGYGATSDYFPAGIQLYMHDTECAVWISCTQLDRYNGGHIYHNHVSYYQPNTTAAFALHDTSKMIVSDNEIEGTPYDTGKIGVQVTYSAGQGNLNNINNNQCLNVGKCVEFGSGTSNNTASLNPSNGGGYTDAGTNNSIAYIDGSGNLIYNRGLSMRGSLGVGGNLSVAGDAGISGGLTVGGAAAFNDPNANSASNFSFSAPYSLNGVNIRLTGPGAGPIAKTLRVYDGRFELINDAYTAILLAVDNNGYMGVSGGLTVGGPVGMGGLFPYANDAAAAGAIPAVPIGGLYINSTTGAVTQRRS